MFVILLNRKQKIEKAINEGKFQSNATPVDPLEQAITNIVSRQMEGFYTKSEISNIVHEALFSKTPAQELMSKTQNIFSNINEKTTPPYKKHYINSSSANGKWVTINGNHVFIKN